MNEIDRIRKKIEADGCLLRAIRPCGKTPSGRTRYTIEGLYPDGMTGTWTAFVGETGLVYIS